MNETIRDDVVRPFAVEPLAVRGRVVRLGASLDAILARHDYPQPVARVLGEVAALAVLLGSSLKFHGQFQLQTKTDGPVEMIVVDFNAPDCLRAYARFDKDRVAALGSGPVATSDLVGKGMLAMTIDQGDDMNRYQGIVALDSEGFEQAAQAYFDQSEQIPTRVRLAVAEEISTERSSYRAGGVMIQFLPSSSEKLRLEEKPPETEPSSDLWDEALALTNTVEDHELVDPGLSSERLLYRLFHERGVRVFEEQSVRESCSCSRERVVAMIRRFSKDDRDAMVGDDGKIGVTCEFCSRHYDFSPGDIGPAEEISDS